MPYRSVPSQLTLCVLAGLLTACAGDPPPPPPPAAEAGILQASPWLPTGRRAAFRAADPRTPLAFEVPNGSKRVSLEVVALQEGTWPLFAKQRVWLRSGGASISTELRVTPSSRGRWTRLSLEIPEDAETLELSAESGEAEIVWWSRPRFEGLAPPGARNLLLVSLDTVRADAVGHLGQLHDTTPNLDALARRGTTWTQAIAPSTWTMPTHVSVMTGQYPSWHGHTALDRRRGPKLPTLAGLLRDAGYDTAAFTGEGLISFGFGATRDFDLIVEHPHTRVRRWWRADDVPEAAVGAAAAVRWLREREALGTPNPFLLFWHTYEPHFPYTDERYLGAKGALPPGVGEAERENWQRYLGDLAVADRALGGLLEALEQLGYAETTDVIVFSDHGEEFGEHSGGQTGLAFQHGHGSWDTLLRVPLVIASPTIAPGVRDDQVSLVDLFPTVLACAGLPSPPSHGRALQVPGGHESVGAEALNSQWATAEEKAWRTSGGLKYVATLGDPPTEGLWDLAADPLEERNLSSQHAEELSGLRDEALAFFASAPEEWAVRGRRDPAAAPDDLPPSVLESLKSLGYVE